MTETENEIKKRIESLSLIYGLPEEDVQKMYDILEGQDHEDSLGAIQALLMRLLPLPRLSADIALSGLRCAIAALEGSK